MIIAIGCRQQDSIEYKHIFFDKKSVYFLRIASFQYHICNIDSKIAAYTNKQRNAQNMTAACRSKIKLQNTKKSSCQTASKAGNTKYVFDWT